MIDSKALEHAAQRSYEYEGDRKGCSYVGWAREPEDVKAEWRASVRTVVLAYLSASPAPGAIAPGVDSDALNSAVGVFQTAHASNGGNLHTSIWRAIQDYHGRAAIRSGEKA